MGNVAKRKKLKNIIKAVPTKNPRKIDDSLRQGNKKISSIPNQ